MSDLDVFDLGKVGDFNYKVIGLSKIGLSHVKNGIENQDSFGFHKSLNSVMLAVADGVGSCPSSKHGSIYAIETIMALQDKIDRDQIKAYASNKIKDFIIREWKGKIKGVLRDYSTTVKFVIISASYILLGGIGDGEIFLSVDNSEYQIRSHSELFSNMTYSLTQYIDVSKFEIIKINIPMDAKAFNVFIGTDGITCELESGKEMDFLKYISKEVREDIDNYEDEIIKWINTLQEKNGDDKTMLVFTAERGTL